MNNVTSLIVYPHAQTGYNNPLSLFFVIF